MSAENGASTSSAPNASVAAPARKSGVVAALEYTGIPRSWLKRPKLPSRNWLIFLSVTSTLTGYYIYDRRECKRIKQEYIDKVQYMSEETSRDHFAQPRKVTVYGARWPGDEDYDMTIKFFRKYVKPILVAAAIDYDIVNGKRHGDLTNKIVDEVKSRRRLDLGIDQPQALLGLPENYPHKDPIAVRKRELEGGIIVVGRPAWKEFLAGLKRGWTESPLKVDTEELLSHELDADGRFDEPEEPSLVDNLTTEDNPSESTSATPIPTPSVFSALKQKPPTPSTVNVPPELTSSTPRPPPHVETPPVSISPLPPIVQVPFIDYLGFKQVPHMIWDWLNQRHKVRAGAHAAYLLVTNQSRPISPSDVDFDKYVEGYYRGYLNDTPKTIEEGREQYYKELVEKLKIAREIARGERDLTDKERENPPKTEVELRDERMKKEQRWRGDAAGWDIVRGDQPAEWDERFHELRMFTDADEPRAEDP